jgi:hypothetical protein
MATPTGIDTVRPNAVVRQQVLIAATQATPILMLRINKYSSPGPADRASTNGRTMYTEHFHIYIIDSPTRHNISHLDKRSSLVHYHRTILYPSIHVCYNSGEVIYCVCVSSCHTSPNTFLTLRGAYGYGGSDLSGPDLST